MTRKKQDLYLKFKQISIKAFKIANLFLLIFTFVFYIIITLIGFKTKTLDPIAGLFDLLLGFSIIMVLFLFYKISHTRFGAFFLLVSGAYWIFIPGNWMIGDYSNLKTNFLGTYIIMWVIVYVLVAIAIWGLVYIVAESIKIGYDKKSVVLGPRFSKISGCKDFFSKLLLNPLDPKQRKKLRWAAVKIFIIFIVVIPGFLSYLNIPSNIKVKVTPKNYPVQFSFWATPDIYGNYSAQFQEEYGVGPRIYNDSVLDEFNKYKVNLDLTMGHINPANIELLKEWEARCPNITYRIVISPSKISEIPILVKQATETLVAYRENNTLTQWRGFAFDIEGNQYRYNFSYSSYEQSTAMWNSVFNYIDNVSKQIGMQIQMESISDWSQCTDVPFDGDQDLQVYQMMNMFYPYRFTTYAPMIYRCSTCGTSQWGSEMNSSDPWSTSYNFYSRLLVLNNTIPHDTMGVYIGITNASCYSRDLKQYEPYSWPASGPNTGLTNLERDVLIAKSFGIKQVTFFLAFTAVDSYYVMGGVFDSYGIHFLDEMNKTVNTNPPKSFYIYYKYSDAVSGENDRTDWLYDAGRLSGILEIIGLWAVSILWVSFGSKITKKFEKNARDLSEKKIEQDNSK